jgi:hypothetical protein
MSMLVVDPWHWLNANGDIPTYNLHLRRQMLRIARFIEYGGPLKKLECRETLMECRKRPCGKPCTGLMWVAKTERDEIQAFCRVCGNDEAAIHNWHETEWANGMMEAVPINFDCPDDDRDPPPAGRPPQSSTAN